MTALYKALLRARGYRVTGPWRTRIDDFGKYRCVIYRDGERTVTTRSTPFAALRAAARAARGERWTT